MITDKFILALAQLNPTMGDFDANISKALDAIKTARAGHADLIIFSELYLCGYPPEDLILKPAFVDQCRAATERLAAQTSADDPAILMGVPWRDEDKVYNAVVYIDQGEIKTQRYKVDLPNYGVFDEKRVFAAGPPPGPINVRGLRVGVPICEDIWGDEDVCETLAESGAEILLVPNGSPYYRGKTNVRQQLVIEQVVRSELPMAYLNQVGGQDELVFDGGSFIVEANRQIPVQLPQFQEIVSLSSWHKGDDQWACETVEQHELPLDCASDWEACVLGLRDYVDKNGFENVVLGLSGGVDSAICAAMSVDALGADRVRCVMMPFEFTSEESLKDAADCAKALGVRYNIVPIEPPVSGFESVLAELFAGTERGVTEENLQSRARGTILMAISNKFGSMVVTTGNKSEMSVGYATLYGDMNGGYNPIKDIYKTRVYELCDWRNANLPTGAMGTSGEVIPQNILVKAPTAELRENQTDQDSLPPYDVLDDILECLVEREFSVQQIVDRGHDGQTVLRIQHLLYIAEYKRRQSAPGVKISRKIFGRDRRYPITSRFRDQLEPSA
jgi:NAD+ synthase